MHQDLVVEVNPLADQDRVPEVIAEADLVHQVDLVKVKVEVEVEVDHVKVEVVVDQVRFDFFCYISNFTKLV